MSILEVSSLTFGYGKRLVLDKVDLAVEHGEVITLLGPNGSGKSTLLRCIAGVLRPSSGTIRLEGTDLLALAPELRARQVGLLFQEHRPVFPFKVIEIACMGRTPHIGALQSPSSEDVRLAMSALERVHMAKHAQRPYTELSGGERQLVLIARTLAQSPAVVLLDEPTAHLDFKNQVLCLNAIRELSAQGTTMIVSSHDPNHAFSLSRCATLLHATGRCETVSVQETLSGEKLTALYELPISVHSITREDGTAARLCATR